MLKCNPWKCNAIPTECRNACAQIIRSLAPDRCHLKTILKAKQTHFSFPNISDHFCLFCGKSALWERNWPAWHYTMTIYCCVTGWKEIWHACAPYQRVLFQSKHHVLCFNGYEWKLWLFPSISEVKWMVGLSVSQASVTVKVQMNNKEKLLICAWSWFTCWSRAPDSGGKNSIAHTRDTIRFFFQGGRWLASLVILVIAYQSSLGCSVLSLK